MVDGADGVRVLEGVRVERSGRLIFQEIYIFLHFTLLFGLVKLIHYEMSKLQVGGVSPIFSLLAAGCSLVFTAQTWDGHQTIFSSFPFYSASIKLINRTAPPALLLLRCSRATSPTLSCSQWCSSVASRSDWLYWAVWRSECLQLYKHEWVLPGEKKKRFQRKSDLRHGKQNIMEFVYEVVWHLKNLAVAQWMVCVWSFESVLFTPSATFGTL